MPLRSPLTLALWALITTGCGTKWNVQDLDDDGVSSAEGDCWDQEEGPEGSGLTGSQIFPGAAETWYDGVDQNCNGDDDYDADADGYVPDEHNGKTTQSVPGSGSLPLGDCWDDPNAQIHSE